MLTSQLLLHVKNFDITSYQLWCHKQNVNGAGETPGKRKRCMSETRNRCARIIFLSSGIDSFCHVRNRIMYVLLWRTVYVHMLSSMYLKKINNISRNGWHSIVSWMPWRKLLPFCGSQFEYACPELVESEVHIHKSETQAQAEKLTSGLFYWGS